MYNLCNILRGTYIAGFFVYQLCLRRDKPKNRFHAMMRSMNTAKHTLFLLEIEVTSFPHLLPCNFYAQFIFHNFKATFDQLPPLSFFGIYRNRPIHNGDFHTYSI